MSPVLSALLPVLAITVTAALRPGNGRPGFDVRTLGRNLLLTLVLVPPGALAAGLFPGVPGGGIRPQRPSDVLPGNAVEGFLAGAVPVLLALVTGVLLASRAGGVVRLATKGAATVAVFVPVTGLVLNGPPPVAGAPPADLGPAAAACLGSAAVLALALASQESHRRSSLHSGRVADLLLPAVGVAWLVLCWLVVTDGLTTVGDRTWSVLALLTAPVAAATGLAVDTVADRLTRRGHGEFVGLVGATAAAAPVAGHLPPPGVVLVATLGAALARGAAVLLANRRRPYRPDSAPTAAVPPGTALLAFGLVTLLWLATGALRAADPGSQLLALVTVGGYVTGAVVLLGRTADRRGGEAVPRRSVPTSGHEDRPG